ncbi:MAG: glycosyltransferase family 2 protein [Granulosicoccus sp.]
MKQKQQIPYVSVIMSTYNSDQYLNDAVNSVRDQSFENWELLITDDASNDDTLNQLVSFSVKDSRIKYFSFEKNSGAALARNNSINMAKGKYIAFLDSDDRWRSNKLQVQCDFMDKFNSTITFSPYEIIDENGNLTGKHVDVGAPVKINYKQLLRKSATFGCLTVMFRRSEFNDYLMPDIRRGQDYALWLKLLRSVESAHKVPKVLAEYRIVKGSISRNKFRKARAQWYVYRRLEKVPLIQSCLAFFLYAWRAVFRK